MVLAVLEDAINLHVAWVNQRSVKSFRSFPGQNVHLNKETLPDMLFQMT